MVEVPAGRRSLEVDLEPATSPVVDIADGDGAPLSEAALTLLLPGPSEDRFRAFAVSDSRGRVRLEGLPPSLELASVATARGKLPRRLLGAAGDLPPEIRLADGCEVVGRAVGERAQPLDGVELEAEGWEPGGHGLLVRTHSRSDGAGGFRIGPLPAAPVMLAARRSDLAPLRRPLDLGSCEGRWRLGDVTLWPARSLAVRVSDDTGGPVAGAEVLTAGGESARTDGRGRAVLHRVAFDEGLELRARATGHLPWEGSVVPPLPEELEVELRRAVRVSGRLVGEDGPPRGAEVRVRQGAGFRDQPLPAEGTFSLDLVPERAAVLELRSPSTLAVVRKVPPLPPGDELVLGDAAPRRGGGSPAACSTGTPSSRSAGPASGRRAPALWAATSSPGPEATWSPRPAAATACSSSRGWRPGRRRCGSRRPAGRPPGSTPRPRARSSPERRSTWATCCWRRGPRSG